MNSPSQSTTASPSIATPKGPPMRSWLTVLGCFLGLSFGQTAMVMLTLGVFMRPLGAEYGWNRGQIALALSIMAITLIFTTPALGRMIDRVGVRRILLPSTAALGVVMCGMYFFSGGLSHFYMMFVLMAIVGTAANNVSYIRVLSAWFIRLRGLVIGLASTGVAAGSAVSVAVAQGLITAYDWRTAYLGLGLIVLFIGLPLVALLVRNDPKDVGLTAYGEEEAMQSKQEPFGVTRTEAIRMRAFWQLIFIAAFMSLALHGIQVHFVPFLLDKGISPAVATGIFWTLMSVGAVVGRVGSGMLFDRYFAPYVATVVFMLPVLSLLLVTNSTSMSALYVMAFFFGIGLGAESDVIGYMVSRYFGMKSIGELYGYLFAAFMAGTASGPALYGLIQARTGSYDSVLILSMVLLAAVCIACATLPKFQDRLNV